MTDDIPAKVMDEILDHINAGEKIAAIRIYKEYRGGKLIDAKLFIEQLMEELENQTTPESAPADLPEEELHRLIYQSRKLKAIKLYRQTHGTSLMDAKQRIEQLTEKLRRQFPGKFEETSKTGCAGMLLAVGTIVAGILGTIGGWLYTVS